MSVPGFKVVRRTLLVGSLAFATCAFGQPFAQTSTPPPAPASTAMSDAQIESNVLRALATAPELSAQNIQTSTVFGTVTMTGNVHDEATRTKAENLVARALGVKKVVDEMTLGDTPPAATDQTEAASQPDEQGAPAQQGQLQSDGSYAPAPPQAGSPDNGQYPGGYGPPQDNSSSNTAPDNTAPDNTAPNGQQYPGGYGPPQGQYPQQGQQPPYPGHAQGQPYPPQGQPYGPPNGEPGPSSRLPMNAPPQNYAPPGGQEAGLPVTIPSGALLRVRINRGIDSKHIQPGTPFDGIVLNDVAAGGAIAIPRGATVQGVVVDAKGSGSLKGRGELGLQISSVTLAGVVYPLNTELWQRATRDKTGHTVNNAIGLGIFGAIIGGIAGGGAGAAIGAGVGGAAGVASSAASPGARVVIPPEAILNFSLAQPAVVKTVSEQEMSRLAYAAGNAQLQRPQRYYRNPGYAPY